MKVPHTHASLVHDLKALGLGAGQVLMMHSSVKKVGKVMGGANVILQAVQEVLTPSGTLMMYAGWQDIPDDLDEVPEELRSHYYKHYPAFDPAISRAVRENSVLVEFFRTFPNTHRSLNPEASMVAWGAQAKYLTDNHPLNYGYGVGSPLEKLVTLNGRILMLGAPLDTITLLHYSEARANLRNKNLIHYQCPILVESQKVWVDIEDLNTGEHHDDYTFEGIAKEYLKAGHGKQGKIGNAKSYLFEAPHLNHFAITWLESHFGK
jgi:aminoglycoside 3-N-acetyltransferase